MINTEEKRKLTEEKMNILEEELNKLFTSGTITLLKIKGFIYSVSVTTGVILLEAILDIAVVSNSLINILYIVSIILFIFGILKGKKSYNFFIIYLFF